MSNYPDGVRQSDVDLATGGNEIPCECREVDCLKCVELLRTANDNEGTIEFDGYCADCGGTGTVIDRTDCPLHGTRRQRPDAAVSPEGPDVEF